MKKYEINIGEIFDLTANSKKPKQTLIITQDQLAVIEMFAIQRKDAELNTIYKLNECEFRIIPHFGFDCHKCKHSFSNPFDQYYCQKTDENGDEYDLEDDKDCGGVYYEC